MTLIQDKPEKESLGSTLRFFLLILLITLSVHSFAFQPFTIPSGSMMPTLLVGDYLFVSKYTYGYSGLSTSPSLGSLSLNTSGFFPKGRLFAKALKRGDVAVFKHPKRPKINYIKRVIGLPGDTVQVRDGVLHLNEQEIPREPVEDYLMENRYGKMMRFKNYIETLPNGVRYHVLDLEPYMALDNTDMITVPEGHYFMMGDNRDQSSDSRVLDDTGFVPFENFVGRAEILFFSRGKRLWNIRIQRFFQRINGIGDDV